jgi:hypothetical protein
MRMHPRATGECANHSTRGRVRSLKNILDRRLCSLGLSGAEKYEPFRAFEDLKIRLRPGTNQSIIGY